jgi:glyoxylase-like metal-dependent hydrolase (beta-lactamase superfamily II)
MPENLGRYDPSLKDIYFIEGIGLCSNVYAFADSQGISLVDTGSGIAPNLLAPQLEQLGLRIETTIKVVITHGHLDHTGGLAEVSEQCSPQVLIHEKDSVATEPFRIKSTNYLMDGDLIQLGRRDFTVLHTPGHTEGSICLHNDEIILSGDTAFPGGYFGRTDLPSGNWQQLLDSLSRLAQLNVRIMLPGHGEPLLSDASSHLKLSMKTAELVRF